MSTICAAENIVKFVCEICDFQCCKKSDWDRHIITRKHQNQQKSTNVQSFSNNDKKFECEYCNKKYKERSGLWKHKKSCLLDYNKIETNKKIDLIIKEKEEQQIEQKQLTNEELTPVNTELIIDFLKQNQDFQKEIFSQMMEFMKTTTNSITNNNNINNGNINNNNNHFNLQFFLNETCKNAMTIDEFIDYIQPTLQELEDTARLGYVEGITRIIMRGLKDLKEELRPFHCSDLKRESLFVKNPDGEWEKETDEKPLMLKFVKAIARKNFNNVNAWRQQNPNCRYHDSKSNDMFNQILFNSSSGRTEEEQKASYEKIIKNITKEIVIDKKAHRNNNK
jgi:hypothetical protein